MTATYTFDVFSSLDGFGAASATWTGYWGKQGPELLDHRLALYGPQQRMVFGATTHRLFARMLASSTEESEVRDPWVARMRELPATVVSATLEEPLDWPNATVVSGDGNDGLIWPHCDGFNWPHFVRPSADRVALIERVSEAGRGWDPEWSSSSRSGVIASVRACRSGRSPSGMGSIAGPCGRRWRQRCRRPSGRRRRGRRRSWALIAS